MDQDHPFNEKAHDWFSNEGTTGWATCPLTENGAMRILGHVRYPKGPGTPGAVAKMLRTFSDLPGHAFWADELSLLSAPHVRMEAIGTAARITDTYLLALAVHNSGKLASFDRRLSPIAVAGGQDALHLIA